MAIARVATRVQSGGHFVPGADIRHRYSRSVRNFLDLYRPIADWWEVTDNTDEDRVLLAAGSLEEFDAENPVTWEAFVRSGDAH